MAGHFQSTPWLRVWTTGISMLLVAHPFFRFREIFSLASSPLSGQGAFHSQRQYQESRWTPRACSFSCKQSIPSIFGAATQPLARLCPRDPPFTPAPTHHISGTMELQWLQAPLVAPCTFAQETVSSCGTILISPLVPSPLLLPTIPIVQRV